MHSSAARRSVACRRALEQVGDAALENPVGGQADGVLEVLGFQELVDLGRGEGGIATEVPPERPVAISSHDRIEDIPPAVSAVNIAGTKGATFNVVELVEHEQWVIAGATEMAVIG